MASSRRSTMGLRPGSSELGAARSGELQTEGLEGSRAPGPGQPPRGCVQGQQVQPQNGRGQQPQPPGPCKPTDSSLPR